MYIAHKLIGQTVVFFELKRVAQQQLRVSQIINCSIKGDATQLPS